MKKLFLSIFSLAILLNGFAQSSENLMDEIEGVWGREGFGEWVFYFDKDEVLIYQGLDMHIDRWGWDKIIRLEDTMLMQLTRGDYASMELKLIHTSDTTIIVYMNGALAGEQTKREYNLNDYGKILEFYKHFPEDYFPQIIRDFKFSNTVTLSELPQSLKSVWRNQEGLELIIEEEFIEVANSLWWRDRIFMYEHIKTQEHYYFVILEENRTSKLAAVAFSLNRDGDVLTYKFIDNRSYSPYYSSKQDKVSQKLNKVQSYDLELADIYSDISGKYYTDLDGFSIEIKDNKSIFFQGESWQITNIKDNAYWTENTDEKYQVYAMYLKRWDEGKKIMEKLLIAHNSNKTVLVKEEGKIVDNEGKSVPFTQNYYKRIHFLPQALKMVAIFMVILLILVFIFYRSVLLPRRLQHNLTRTRLQGVKAQLNPHFLFNSMASIQSLMNQNRIEDANQYLAELSDLLRYHLDEGSDDLVLLSEELDAIQHYCKLEALRAPFDLDIQIQENIKPENLEIPTQLLQPVVENAIKHGLRHTIAPQLMITVSSDKDHLVITIEDNGPGIHQKELASANNSRKTHQGISLIEEKVRLLKKQGLDVEFTIHDLAHDLNQGQQGTQVKLSFPLLIS